VLSTPLNLSLAFPQANKRS